MGSFLEKNIHIKLVKRCKYLSYATSNKGIFTTQNCKDQQYIFECLNETKASKFNDGYDEECEVNL